VRCKNGAWQWHASTASALKDPDGRVVSYLGISRDVSERKQAEEALRGNERKLANAMKIARLGYWEYDVASNLFTFDDHFYALFHTSAEQVGGYTMSPERYASLFVHPEDAYMVEVEMQKAFSTTDPDFSSQLEHRILFADGKTGHIAVRYYIVKDKQGRTIKTYGANQDITERKQAEIALRESEEQLRQAQKLESVGRLAGGVAHDFNNMLAAILGNAEILQTRLAPDRAGNKSGHETSEKTGAREEASEEIGEKGSDPWDSLEQIVNAAHLAGDLTHQLLAFGRRQGAEPDLLDPGELVADAMKMLRRLVSENIQIRTLVRPGLKRVWADPTQLSQVLMNLVVNACDAMPGGGELSIDVSNEDLEARDAATRANVTAGPFVRIRVRDSGSGMDEETHRRMFDPFFTTKPVGKGSGLGLSVVYGIVEQANGHLTVDSRPGHETTVEVWLPAARADAVAREKQKTVPEPIRGTETILVCEDEEMVREPLCSVLQSRGFTVIEARDGKQALERIGAHDGPIHLLLTDVIMPGMNGPELARILEKRYGISRVIFTSGYASEDVFAGVALGEEVRFVEKPCTPSELLQHVQELLNATSGKA
jgi:signal transduction histidine kinase/CheY-like chemotaxis protein